MRKKTLRGLAVVLLAALLVGMPTFVRWRPRSGPELLQPEDEGWEGILSFGVVETFRAGGDVMAYAERVARLFEKTAPGVLIAVREMTPASLLYALEAGTAPDMLLFGAGAVREARQLVPLAGDFSAMRGEFLRAAGEGDALYALPVAFGGYAAIGNLDLLEAAGALDAENWPERLALLPGNAIQCPARGHTYPAAGLIAVTAGAVLAAPDALPRQIGEARRELAWPEFALENRYAGYLGTQYEIARMRALEAGGRVAPWAVLPPDGRPYTDQVLLVGVVRPDLAGRDPADAGRSDAAGAFASFFLGGEARASLTVAGLLPVAMGGLLYADVPGMADLEAHYQAEALVPNVFTQYDEIQLRDATLAAAADFVQGLRGASATP